MFPDHDYYDPRSDSWTELPDMPLPAHGVTGSAFVNGLVHAPGGGIEVGGSSGQPAQSGLQACRFLQIGRSDQYI
jgi:hypothetical protein